LGVANSAGERLWVAERYRVVESFRWVERVRVAKSTPVLERRVVKSGGWLSAE
jgi:hypothetical protein